MKGKLYVFAIGGTGARVLKSLVMMLASGVKLDASAIVPVLVDLDKSNGSLAETLTLLDHYKRLQQAAQHNTEPDGFFKTLVTLPKNQTSHALNLHVARDGAKAQQVTLKEFIAYDHLGASDSKYLVDLLYSRKNLEDNLAVGFRGQPHIGAITFYNITKVQAFVSLCQELTEDDRVFFVSSIFGGTGAAGFPTLLKILRDRENGLPNQKIRATIPVGALIVLPYFHLEEKVDQEFIDSNLFMTKTKLALSYYSDHLSGYDAMYYLCEPYRMRKYNNEPGSELQKNEAHFIEFFAGKSIFHFAALDSEALEQNPHFEYASRNEGPAILTYKDLEENPAERQVAFKKQLAALAYMSKYFYPAGKSGKPTAPHYKGAEWVKGDKGDKGFDRFFESSFFKETFMPFLKNYDQWLREMANPGNGKFAFAPFDMEAHDDSMGSFFKDQRVRDTGGVMGLGARSALHHSFFNTKLNAAAKKYHTEREDTRFLQVLHQAVNELFEGEKLFS